LAVVLAWTNNRRLEVMLDRLDARTLEESSRVLDYLVAQQGQQLTSEVAVLSEDARVRAMVLTPTFDRATALDLLEDLKATSGASMVAILDNAGTVRAVAGAREMDQLNLSQSSLVRNALERPSAQLSALGGRVGVLSAAPVRLDNQVRALFMMGFAIEDALLQGIQRALGSTGALFVGDEMVASANRDPEMERALRSAAALPPGGYRIVQDTYVACSGPLQASAVATTVAWLVPLYRHTDEVTLTRALSWVPAVLVGLVLAFTLALVLGPSHQRRSLGN
jgi:hypothetical protein